MDRRGFIRKAGVAAAAVPALAAPAIAQSMPEIKWRMTSSFPKALDTIFGAAETFARFVAEATDNKFQIQVFPGGRNRPGAWRPPMRWARARSRCARRRATITGARTRPSPSATAVPFGLNARQQNAWMYHGGGMDLMNEFYATQNLIGFPVRQHGRADGRLVPQGDQLGRRPARA